MSSKRAFGRGPILVGLGVLALLLLGWFVGRERTSRGPAGEEPGTTAGAGEQAQLTGRGDAPEAEAGSPALAPDRDAQAGGPTAGPLFRSSLFVGGRMLRDMLSGPHREQSLETLQMVLEVSQDVQRKAPIPAGVAVLPGRLRGSRRDLAQMSPLLLGILDEVWRARTRTKSEVEAARSFLERLISDLGAPQVELQENRPEANREALTRLATWFEGLVGEDASFEAMLTGGGHPKITMEGPGLVGITPPTDLELGDRIARVELGEGLFVEAFEVDHGGKAAVLRGTSREGEPWSVLLTNAEGEPYRAYQLHDLQVDDLGPLGWRVGAHVSGDALHLYLTPDGAFRFYLARFQGTVREAQTGHLQSLASEGDAEELKRLLDAGADPRATGEANTTLLHLAAAHGQAAAVALLIERGALIDAQDEAGLTALHFAAHAAPRPPWESKRPAKGTEHVAAARMLLEHGARLDAGLDGKWGWGTPLHLAALAGHVPMARFLIEQGADVNAVDPEYRTTPLSQAARMGVLEPGIPGWSRDGDHIGMVRLLLEHGANPNVPGSLAGKLLRMAFRSRALDVVDRLIEAVAAAGGDALESAMRQACRAGQVPLMERLLEAGAPLNAVTRRGSTLLHEAAQGGSLEALRLLLAKGCDVHAQNANGNTALHDASRFGRVHAVRLLVDRGADRNAGNEIGNTPLHAAAARNQLEVLTLLVERGANLGAVNEAGESPLHVAAASCSTSRQTFEFLVKRGLDVHARTHAGKTPLQLALEEDCFMGSMAPTYLRELGAKR